MEGGTSNINALIYLRGHPLDYDRWAALTGDPLWNYKNVTEFFKNFENFVDNHGNSDHIQEKRWSDIARASDTIGTFTCFADGDKGHNGELVIEDISQTHGMLADFFVQAGVEAGYPMADLNGNYSQGEASLSLPPIVEYSESVVKYQGVCNCALF